ncbi:MAG: archaeosortase/exosortase family protein [Saprospiraceae bacterium]|nr:archaeosortase/exosortase family protein [Saprospiraceae bacterium]
MIRFWILFLSVLAAFYWLNTTYWYIEYLAAPSLHFYSFISAGILNLFGYGITVYQGNMSGKLFSMSIATGCDAIAPMFMLISAIGFYTYGSLRNKLLGILLGCSIVFVLNIVRIISLYLIGIYANDWFEFFHLEFWQVLFILVAMIYFLYWLRKYSE